MEVKGVVLKNQKRFVKDRYGEKGWEDLTGELDEESAEVLQETILESSWYPYGHFREMNEKVSEVFDGEDSVRELGRYDTEKALSGVYSIWAKFSSPQGLAKRAPEIFNKHYRPIEVEVVENREDRGVLRLYGFPEDDELVEKLISGNLEKGSSMVGAGDPEVEIAASVTSGDEYTEFKVDYDG
ncbi:MAG: hypothetical protein ABEK01_04805 [Candidatus Nanohaloarchaea archaeon]